ARPLRPDPTPRRGAAGGGPPPRRVRSHRRARGGGRPQRRPHRPAAAEGEPGHPAAPVGARRRLQGRRRPTHRAARARTRRRGSRASAPGGAGSGRTGASSIARTVRRLLAVFAALAALSGAACGTLGPAAATVNGTHISQRDFDEELRQIADNKTYRQSIEQRLPVLGQGRGTVDASFAAQVLTRRILFELVHQEVERRHLKVTATDLSRARQDIVQQVGGQKVYAAYSSTYRKLLTRRFAEVGVVQLAVANVKVDARSVAAYYDQHKDEFTQ